MENLIEIWKQVCESNLFNFVVMILFLGWIIKKCDLAAKLEAGRKKIEDAINNSEKAKETSLKNLYETQENAVQIDEEIFQTLNSAEKNAKEFGEKLLEDISSQKAIIKQAQEKTIEANAKSLRTEIMTETADKALKLAESQIKEKLEKDSDLHQKFINKSIDAINEIKVEL